MMKKFLIVAGLVASTASYGMFKNIETIEKEGKLDIPKDALEAMAIVSTPPYTQVSFVHNLTGVVPGFFGSTKITLAKFTVELVEDGDAVKKITKVSYGPQFETNLIEAVSKIKSRGFQIGTEKIGDWKDAHEQFYNEIFGRDGKLDAVKTLKIVENAADFLRPIVGGGYSFSDYAKNAEAFDRPRMSPPVNTEPLKKFAQSLYALSNTLENARFGLD